MLWSAASVLINVEIASDAPAEAVGPLIMRYKRHY